MGGFLTTRSEPRRISRCIGFVAQLLFLCAASILARTQTSQQSGDGYVRRAGNEWTFGTSKVEQRVRLADGHFSLVSLRNKVSGREYQPGADFPAEIAFFANGHDVSASNWHWNLRGDRVATGAQGELQLDIEVESAGIRVIKHYLIYPGTAVVRQWLTLKNASDSPARINQIEFLHSNIDGSLAPDLQFNYLTGGGN